MSKSLLLSSPNVEVLHRGEELVLGASYSLIVRFGNKSCTIPCVDGRIWSSVTCSRFCDGVSASDASNEVFSDEKIRSARRLLSNLAGSDLKVNCALGNFI